jgi:hypothetical protein
MVPFLAASAQQSLCNPCVDPPASQLRRNGWIDFSGPVRTNATVIVTAEDMRNLGVVSVAEMANQLPSNVPASLYDRSITLGDAAGFPEQLVSALGAAAGHLQSLELEPAEFNARLVTCVAGSCTLFIYPAELGDASAMIVGECPVGYCATMLYSLVQDRIVVIRELPSGEAISR